MAAPIVRHFVFEGQVQVPNMYKVVDELMVVSGLLIEMDSQSGGIKGSTIWKVRSLSAPMNLIIAQEKGALSYTVAYDPFCKWTPYLAGTLQFVFAKWGGACEEKAPDWVGARWAEVKKNWKPNCLRSFL